MNHRAHRRNTTIAIVACLALIAFGLYMATRRPYALDLSGIPSGVWIFLAGFAIRFKGAVRLGRWQQAIAHTILAVGKGHRNLLRGGH